MQTKPKGRSWSCERRITMVKLMREDKNLVEWE